MDKAEISVMRGEEAQRIVDSDLFGKAFDDTRQALMNTWATLDTTDDRYAEFAKDIHRKVKCLDAVKRCLVEHITTGKLSQKTIEAASKRPLSFQGMKNAFRP